MRHFRINIATGRGDAITRRTDYAREADVCEQVERALGRQGLISITVRPISEAKFIRATRPGE